MKVVYDKFYPRAEMQAIFLSQETTSLHKTRVAFSARAEIPLRLHGIFADFSVRLLGLKIPLTPVSESLPQLMEEQKALSTKEMTFQQDKCYQNQFSHPVGSELCNGQCYPPFEQLGPGQDFQLLLIATFIST